MKRIGSATTKSLSRDRDLETCGIKLVVFPFARENPSVRIKRILSVGSSSGCHLSDKCVIVEFASVYRSRLGNLILLHVTTKEVVTAI